MMQLIRWVIDMKLMIQWAITSSALILIVLAARYLFRNKLSARLRYALWGVVLLRLLVPFQVELPAPVSNALPVLASNFAPEVADMELYALRTASRPMSEDNLAEMRERGVDPGTVIGTEAPIYQIGDVEIEGYAHCFVLSENSIDTYFFYTTLPKFLTALWVIGAVWAAWTIFSSNRYFLGRLRYYRHELERTDAPIPVYTAANLSSPCLFGVFKPAVYVTPGAAKDETALRHILAHELTHYAHRDHIWSLLRCLALALHWYNPLVWLAVILSKRDGEMACDEGSVARLGEGERIPYGRTLVDMVAARSPRPGDLLSCSTAMTGGEKSVKARVLALVKKPETVRTALFALVAVVAVASVFVFVGRSEQGKDGDYQVFQSDVKNAQSIHLSQETTSSYANPTAITDPELLSQAKDVLLQGASDWLNPPSVLENLDLSSLRTLTLTGQNGDEFRYQLVRFDAEDSPTLNSQLCVITEGSLSNVRSSRVAVLLDQEAVPKIYELMRQRKNQNGSPELDRYFADLDSATSIRYCPPTYSSTIYPNPITREDLLAEAKEALSGFRYLEDGDPQPDLSPTALIHESRIVLTFEGGEMEYSLLWQNDRTYLFLGSIFRQYLDLKEEEGETAQLLGVSGTCVSEVNVVSAMESLARQQLGRGEKVITPSVTPELEEFFTQLEAAQFIYVGQLSLSSASPPGLISDPVAVAQAKELLGKATGPLQLGKDITEEELLNIRRSLSSAVDTEPVHITPEELKNMLFMRGNPILLCPGPEVTPDLEFRHWLADNTLLLWDAELEENPKVLATFSEDVYSQLAELARSEEPERVHSVTGS